MSKQLLLNDLIKAVEQRQELKSALTSIGDVPIPAGYGEMMLSDMIKRYDVVIADIEEKINRDRTNDMKDFWIDQALDDRKTKT